MRVTFLVRERMLPGTALHNAAGYDGGFLVREGHAVTVVPEKVDMPFRALESDLYIVEGACWASVKALKTLPGRVIVRIHAAPEFVHFERPGSCATTYIKEARAAGITVGFVSRELATAFGCPWLPINYPLARYSREAQDIPEGRVEVGCFGAIRSLKNQVTQMLAVSLARSLYFPERKFAMHVNSTRLEMEGRELWAELQALSASLNIPLVSHLWHTPEEFKAVIPTMTFAMCGSLAESFCLTAADFVSAGKPTVLSTHIPWAPCYTRDTVRGMADAVRDCLLSPQLTADMNWNQLHNYLKLAPLQWRSVLQKDSYVTAN